nr:phosphoribosyltransferase [Chloroflexia bacterium]
GNVLVLNDEVVAEARIAPDVIEAVAVIERGELVRRERLYRGARPPPELRGRTVILVDDGLATGSTMRAAVAAVQAFEPRWTIVAVPVAAPSVCRAFEPLVDRIVCGATPQPFFAVGPWYIDFAQTTDAEVRRLLAEGDRG